MAAIKKMDSYLISNQAWELDYVAQKFSIGRKDVRAAIKAVGNSRRKVYNWIRQNFSLKLNEE